MKAIPFQVVDINLLELNVSLNQLFAAADPQDRIEDFDGVTFNYSIGIDDYPPELLDASEDDSSRYFTVKLGLRVEASEGARQLPVSFACDMGAVVTSPGSIGPEEARYFAVLHGSSILYSAIRQRIVDTTALMPCGKVTIPTMSLADDVERYRPKSLKSPQSAKRKPAESRAKRGGKRG